jgi:preprotein translocase subunit SecB
MSAIEGKTVEQNQDQAVVFSIEKIYLKDVSYEAPGVPMVFALQTDGREVNVQLGVEHSMFNAEHGLHEVVLTVTATAKRENKNIFLVEVKQAGVFKITGLDSDALQKTLEISCPNILLPFVREAVNELVVRGGFAQLLINPINFESLYEQRLSAEQKKAHS